MEVRHFDLNLLRSLDALLKEQNVTRAAERLCVTQQAMSGALGRLRAHFNDPLLMKVGRHSRRSRGRSSSQFARRCCTSMLRWEPKRISNRRRKRMPSK
jgi:DNA-binding transcriptional LysR family regulator